MVRNGRQAGVTGAVYGENEQVWRALVGRWHACARKLYELFHRPDDSRIPQQRHREGPARTEVNQTAEYQKCSNQIRSDNSRTFLRSQSLMVPLFERKPSGPAPEKQE